MSYPSAYCIKCKAHTDTLGRHTIQLSNNRRAMKGICPVCATETYRFMPVKGQKKETELSLISSQRRLPKNGNSALKFKPALTSETNSAAASRLDSFHVGLADKLVHFGTLLVIFGLSFVVGFMVLKLIKTTF